MRQILQPGEPITIREVVSRLGVTPMTVHLWRKGSRRRPPLVAYGQKYGDARRVSIDKKDLTAWLRVHRPDLVGQWRT